MRYHFTPLVQFSSVQLLSHVRLFATPWTAACQASLSTTDSQSLLYTTKVTIIKKTDDDKHWKGCGEIRILRQC